MISKEFKNFAAGVKKLNIVELPYNILVDKSTGEPKPSAKNLKAFELVSLISKLPQSELSTLKMGRMKRGDTNFIEAGSYLKSVAGNNFDSFYLRDVLDLYIDYTKKVEAFQAKKDREAKKLAVAKEKDKLILSLSRSDIKNSMDMIKKSMEPYIKRSENSIKETITKKETEFLKEWKEIEKSMEKDGVELVNPSKSIEGKIMYSGVRYTGPAKTLKEYIRYNFRGFFVKWFDNKGYGLTTSAKYISNGQASELITTLQKQFRQSQEFKVEVLFHRLIKTNPTLKGYVLSSPYNGNEFMMEATNDRGEKVIITTNTILAGGYNIQRLHSRWLVQLRNSVTGKQEKFTIDDKTKA
jgi:hypothetical protein